MTSLNAVDWMVGSAQESNMGIVLFSVNSAHFSCILEKTKSEGHGLLSPCTSSKVRDVFRSSRLLGINSSSCEPSILQPYFPE